MTETHLLGKVAIVTNAHHPIGVAIIRKLLSKGAVVLGVGLASPSAYEKQFGSYSYQGDVAFSEVELTDPQNIPVLFDHVERSLGSVDILINNVVIAELPSVLEITAASFDLHITDRLRTTILLTAEYVRRYLDRNAQWGRVVNLCTFSSVEKRNIHPTQLPESPVQKSLAEITRITAKQVAPFGITVNAVASSSAAVGLIKSGEAADCKDFHEYPTDKLDSIAEAIFLFLAEGSSALTGQVLQIDPFQPT